MFSPFLIEECDGGLFSVDRAEAARDRLIPAAMIAPPTRTFLRDISLLSIVIWSGNLPAFDVSHLGKVCFYLKKMCEWRRSY